MFLSSNFFEHPNLLGTHIAATPFLIFMNLRCPSFTLLSSDRHTLVKVSFSNIFCSFFFFFSYQLFPFSTYIPL